MSARAAGYAATGLSILSVALCLVFVPILWQKGALIESDLRRNIGEFKLLENEVWGEVVVVRRDKGSACRSTGADNRI